MSKEEKSAILASQELSQPGHQLPVSYGVVEIDILAEPKPAKKWRPTGGMATASIFAVTAVIVAIVFIFGLIDFTSTNPETTVILRQSDPYQNHVDITIPQGRIRGYVRTSRQGREFAAFYKVPYAQPPIGKLRFKDPEPATSWTGLHDASEPGPQCLQNEKHPEPPNATYAVGEEDCLYATIFVPNSRSLKTTPTYPTMLYFHGGGISGNSSKYGGEYFMDEDVIIIMFNFRLGPLANLNTGDDVIRGNMGFKDMVQMLKWIRDNIENFGGDPQRVTVFGNSAGGMTAAMLMISPMTEGLIHRAISQSGGVICMPALGLFSNRPENSLEIAAKAHNCPSSSSEELLKCLQGKSGHEIATTREAVPYVLTVEDRPNPVEGTVFMPDKPYNLLRDGKAHPVPHIFGNVNAEGVGDALEFLDDHELIRNLNQDFEKYAQEIVTVTDMNSQEMQSLKEYFFGDKEIGNQTLMNLTDLVGDKKFVHCTYKNAMMHAKYAKSYFYWLTKAPAKSYVEKKHPDFPTEERGLVYHGDELQYHFPYRGFPEISLNDEKYIEFSKYFTKLWAHFATTGDPNMNGLTWRSLDADKPENNVWLELNDEVKETTEIIGRMQFWDQFSPEQLINL